MFFLPPAASLPPPWPRAQGHRTAAPPSACWPSAAPGGGRRNGQSAGLRRRPLGLDTVTPRAVVDGSQAAAQVERAQAANFVGYKPQPGSLMLPALPFLLIATLDRLTLYGRLLNRLTLLSHLANRRPGLPKRMVIGRDSGLNDSRQRHASLFGQFLKHLNRSGREPKTLHWISHKHLLNAMIV
jgi:hypothetical protein